jgi:azurin
MKKFVFTFILALGIISCGNDSKKSLTEENPVAQTQEFTNVIDLKATDDMKFDKTKFTVKANQEVTLNFTNVGVLPLETMGHNVVILKPKADVQAFANASAKAKESNYVSDLYITDIIAQTKLLGPGESETIKFTLKDKGDYTFICTFPGHWIAMKGTITAL